MRVDPTQLAAKAGEIILTLSKEGDRGCVLVAAVLLEQAIESSIDVPPVLSSTAIWSPIPPDQEIGREEALFRRTDHRLPA